MLLSYGYKENLRLSLGTHRVSRIYFNDYDDNLASKDYVLNFNDKNQR